MLRTASHCWINKMMKIQPEQYDYFTAGKEGHRIIQDHVAGIKKDPRLAFLTEVFPIVERRDFDPDCKFKMEIRGYDFIGFYDGKDPAYKRFLEIKLSSSPWTLGKFKDAIQRKIYALAEPTYTEAMLITGSLKPDEWIITKPKIMTVDLTKADRDEAMQWINEGIDIFENGDFNGGLDENGRCNLGRGCPWGDACHFKHI